MALLIAILLKLGFYYTPEQAETGSNSQNEEVIYAHHIIDEGLYHYDEDGGVVIEDDVDPGN
jgi:hypothetical protein